MRQLFHTTMCNQITHQHTWMRNQSLLHAVALARVAHQHLPGIGAGQHGPPPPSGSQGGHHVCPVVPSGAHGSTRVQAEGGEAPRGTACNDLAAWMGKVEGKAGVGFLRTCWFVVG